MKKAIGRSELERHASRKRLTQRGAIKAKCYDCMGCYVDGKVDCLNKGCPLHPYMPYRGVEEIGQRQKPKTNA